MKNVSLFILLSVFLASALYAGINRLTAIGPATATSTVTISAAGTGIKNCITDVDVISDSAYTFRVLSGATTIYALTLGANTGLVRAFDDPNALCSSNNAQLQIKVSAGTYQINYQGYTR